MSVRSVKRVDFKRKERNEKLSQLDLRINLTINEMQCAVTRIKKQIYPVLFFFLFC